jgi:hypothetical protein
MTVRALDSTGDIATSGAQFFSGYSALEVAQNVRTRLKLFTNEWFLNINEGTPWFDSAVAPGILGKNTRTAASREAVIRRRIFLSPGMAGMTSFKVDYDLATRSLSVQAGTISKSGEQSAITYVQAPI